MLGLRFGRLVVCADAGTGREGKALWLCRCDCGNSKKVVGKDLRRGDTRSCGCLARELMSARAKHGHSRGGHPSPEYRAWKGMIRRCTAPRDRNYPNYGGRGISVYPGWVSNFQEFLAHIGPRPGREYSLDRERVDGNYEPGNVRWATNLQQQRNKRSTIYVQFGERTVPLYEAAEALGLRAGTVRQRIIRDGMTPQEALRVLDHHGRYLHPKSLRPSQPCW